MCMHLLTGKTDAFCESDQAVRLHAGMGRPSVRSLSYRAISFSLSSQFRRYARPHSSVHHVHTFAQHGVHLCGLPSSANQSKPGSFISARNVRTFQCQTGMIHAGGPSASRGKCVPRGTPMSPLLCCAGGGKVSVRRKQSSMIPSWLLLACICPARQLLQHAPHAASHRCCSPQLS